MSAYELHFLVVDTFRAIASLVKLTVKFAIVMAVMCSPWIIEYLFETFVK